MEKNTKQSVAIENLINQLKELEKKTKDSDKIFEMSTCLCHEYRNSGGWY